MTRDGCGRAPNNMNQPAKQPEQRQQQAHPAIATGIEPMPAALRDSLKVKGVELSGATQAAAHLLVTGTLAPASRFRYGKELGAVSRWCMEHELDLLALSPQDIGALVVARRDAGQSPRLMLTALAFVYRPQALPRRIGVCVGTARGKSVAGTESGSSAAPQAGAGAAPDVLEVDARRSRRSRRHLPR